MSPKEDFEEAGYLFQKKFVDCSELAEINENLRRLIANVVPSMPSEHVFYEDSANRESLKQLQLLHKHDEFFQRLIVDSPFRLLAEKLLGESVTCQNLQYFNKPPVIGKPTPAHQDGFYFKLEPPVALTMWLALDRVDTKNGCVRYVTGSHKLGMRPHGKTGTLGFSQGITDFPNSLDRQNEVAFPAEPGDLLAHHCLTIHRADGNESTSRTRRALGFIYYGVSANVDVAARSQYKADLKEQHNSIR